MTPYQPITPATLNAAHNTPMGLMVQLSSVGNPDFGQNPNKPLYGVKNQKVTVGSLAEASKACQEFIQENELGGGNWAGGQVTLPNGTPVAYISYNGRVWGPLENGRVSGKEFPAVKVIYQTGKKLLWVLSTQFNLCFQQEVTRKGLETPREIAPLADEKTEMPVDTYLGRCTKEAETHQLIFSMYPVDLTNTKTLADYFNGTPLATAAVELVR